MLGPCQRSKVSLRLLAWPLSRELLPTLCQDPSRQPAAHGVVCGGPVLGFLVLPAGPDGLPAPPASLVLHRAGQVRPHCSQGALAPAHETPLKETAGIGDTAEQEGAPVLSEGTSLPTSQLLPSLGLLTPALPAQLVPPAPGGTQNGCWWL